MRVLAIGRATGAEGIKRNSFVGLWAVRVGHELLAYLEDHGQFRFRA